MLAQLVVLAVLTEAVTELAKDVVSKGFAFSELAALLFGQIVAWGTGMDLLSAVGIEGAPWLTYVGIVLTGLVVSRGANYIHGLWDRLNEARGSI